MKHAIPMLAALLLAPFAGGPSRGDAQPPERARPNVVMIVVDDAALMDFGAFGGEARTPNIDALAQRGARFTNYHTSPLCSPSRAMLLTGVDNHRTGVATIEEVLPSELAGRPGYSLHFEPGVTTVAERLRHAGYRTYMTGKWHLGHGPGDLPNAHGFDRSLALDASGADNWEQKPYMPYYDEAPWFEDGEPTTLPDEFYSSELLVDRMIDYLDRDKNEASPFFAYVAFQAVHIPVQAPAEITATYAGRFDEGWQALRRARWQRAIEMGLIPRDAELAEMPESTRAWEDLSPDERAMYAKSMAVYSAMLEAMDVHIGRLVDHIRSLGQLDNTLFVVTSDNGPEPSDPVHTPGMGLWMATHGYEWELDTLGEKGSLGFLGPDWAAAISSPSRLFKFYTTEGGIRVPLVVAGPGVDAERIHSSLAFVTDVTPTILDFANVDPTAIEGAVTMDGRSLRPVLSGARERTYGEDETVGVEVAGNLALFRGTYKLVYNAGKFGDGVWHLYDLARDPGEASDLARLEPERLADMIGAYREYKRRAGVLDLPSGYNVESQLTKNAVRRQLGFYVPYLLTLSAIAAALLVVLVRRRRA